MNKLIIALLATFSMMAFAEGEVKTNEAPKTEMTTEKAPTTAKVEKKKKKKNKKHHEAHQGNMSHE